MEIDLHDQVRKCVGFICYFDKDGKEHFAGTGFYISRAHKYLPTKSYIYFVTAKHVVQNIFENCGDGLLNIRVNLNTSPYFLFIQTDIKNWRFHSDVGVDIAVMRTSSRREITDVKVIPPSMFELERPIRLTDEIIIAGLFTKHIGKKKNIPIIRMGNIVSLPEEPIKTKEFLMEAYLVETRSIGGLSGAPVFRRDTYTQLGVQVERLDFIGVMHGHWDVSRAISAVELEVVNMGIGIVIPSKKILEVIEEQSDWGDD